MTTKFKVQRTFELESRGFYVLVGELCQGVVQAGMVLDPENGSENQFEILSVEFVDGSSIEDSSPSLCVSLEQVNRLQLRSELLWKGAELICK